MQAETLKYFYLLFSPNHLLSIDKIVFNTEAHIFPRFKLARGLKTGWTRRTRDSAGRIIDRPNQKAAETQTGHAHGTASDMVKETAALKGHIGLV